MNISEIAIDAEMLNKIKCCAQDAAAILGLDISQPSPAEIIDAVNLFVLNLPDRVILLDTSFNVALENRNDPHHQLAKQLDRELRPRNESDAD